MSFLKIRPSCKKGNKDMKKSGIFILALFMMLTAGLMSGCGKKETYQDGSYRAEAKEYDINGWKDYLAVQVEGGKIISAEYDALYESDGHKKTEDTAYQEKYRAAGLGTDPADTSARLTDSYLERQSAEKVDAVSGATSSSAHFAEMAKALEKRMKNGETGNFTIELGE